MPYTSERKNKDNFSYNYRTSFIKNCPDILMHLDEDFRVLFVNKAYQSAFNISEQEMIGCHWSETPLGKEHLVEPGPEELRKILLIAGKSFDFTFRISPPDSDQDCEFHGRLYAEMVEEPPYMTYWLVARDMNPSENTSGKVRATENNYHRLVENYPDLVCRYNKDHKIVYVNEACREFFGMSTEEMIGKTKDELGLIGNKAAKTWNNKLELTFDEGAADDFTFSIDFKEQARFFHAVIVPEMDDSGTVDHVLAFTREVTDLKATETALRKDNDNLRSLNTYLDNFIYTIAHDLRGPVGNLKSLLWLYKLENNDKAREDIMGKLEATFGRLDNRLNGLIGLIESMANLESKIATCKLENIIRDIQADLENRPDFTPYTIHKHLDVKEIKYIEAYMVSILSNLLSNIMKYREPSRPLRIRVSTYRMGKFVILEVEDNGIGIDLDTIGNDLFKPFRRFTKQSEGKGIGLHIIKTMVEKNGGRIEVSSTVGEGTTFQLYLKEY